MEGDGEQASLFVGREAHDVVPNVEVRAGAAVVAKAADAASLLTHEQSPGAITSVADPSGAIDFGGDYLEVDVGSGGLFDAFAHIDGGVVIVVCALGRAGEG